jgi:CubicO group peptidase (beta-lactamase class C family)
MRRSPLPFVLAVLLAAAPLAGQASDADLSSRVSKALDSLAALDQFSGVVFLAKNGAPVFERAYGMADREARRANDLETAFNLGSINKAFTATAIRQLAAAGKLVLDSTYVVLGLLVERLSGENHHDYVRRHIYEPAGMTRTGSWAVDSLPANTAIGYTRGGPDQPACPAGTTWSCWRISIRPRPSGSRG